jgi:hypothetical protein
MIVSSGVGIHPIAAVDFCDTGSGHSYHTAIPGRAGADPKQKRIHAFDPVYGNYGSIIDRPRPIKVYPLTRERIGTN